MQTEEINNNKGRAAAQEQQKWSSLAAFGLNATGLNGANHGGAGRGGSGWDGCFVFCKVQRGVFTDVDDDRAEMRRDAL